MWFYQQVLIWRVLPILRLGVKLMFQAYPSVHVYTVHVWFYQHVLIWRVFRPKVGYKADVSSVSVSTYKHYMCGLINKC